MMPFLITEPREPGSSASLPRHRLQRRAPPIVVADSPAIALPLPLLRLQSYRGELANETPLSPRPRTSSSCRFRKIPSSPPLAMAPPRLELLQPASGPANELRTLPGDEHHHSSSSHALWRRSHQCPSSGRRLRRRCRPYTPPPARGNCPRRCATPPARRSRKPRTKRPPVARARATPASLRRDMWSPVLNPVTLTWQD